MADEKRLLALDRELNLLVMDGRMSEAFDRFYCDDVSIGENDKAPTIGKAANLARERAFLKQVERFNSAKVLASGVGGQTTFSKWYLDLAHRELGHLTFTQIAVRTWARDRVAEEVFFYGMKTDFVTHKNDG